MIKGEIKMTFDEQGAHVDTDIRCSEGMADKCFIIGAVCDALQLKGSERTFALAMVAAVKEEEEEDEETEEENESRCI